MSYLTSQEWKDRKLEGETRLKDQLENLRKLINNMTDEEIWD